MSYLIGLTIGVPLALMGAALDLTGRIVFRARDVCGALAWTVCYRIEGRR